MAKRKQDPDDKRDTKPGFKEAASDAARALAMRSVAARKKKWGAKEFKKRMQEWGKLGGRPRKTTKKSNKRKERK
jgi:hypothetical protein